MPLQEVPPARQLMLDVQPLARQYGVETAAGLASYIHTNRQGLYDVWRGSAQAIQLATYSRLLQGLSPPETLLPPGDWFRWSAQDGVPRLVWQVQDLARQRNWSFATFWHTAGLGSHDTAWRIWTGQRRSTFLDTLARIALAFEAPGQPFELGALLVWTAPEALARAVAEPEQAV